MPMRVDLFCRVVDNFGDIGVCWRLARRLAHHRGCAVRLWIDDLASFRRLVPRVDVKAENQVVEGIAVRRWTRDDDVVDASGSATFEPGELIIEAFACDPPREFVRAMQCADPAPVWFNLEYLATESWADDCHGLTSARADGLYKAFIFPGFSPRTGGLLREPGLIANRESVQQTLPTDRIAVLTRYGFPTVAHALEDVPGARLLTLFAYPTLPLDALFEACAAAWSNTIIAVAEGVCPQAESAATKFANVTVVRFPFVTQDAFDRLLWCGDLNMVRGEDSFVRAIWAGRPLIWQIYPQDEAAHFDKLDAWLGHYAPPAPISRTIRALNGSDSDGSTAAHALRTCLSEPNWSAWQSHSYAYSERMSMHAELADHILDVYSAVLKKR